MAGKVIMLNQELRVFCAAANVAMYANQMLLSTLDGSCAPD